MEEEVKQEDINKSSYAGIFFFSQEEENDEFLNKEYKYFLYSSLNEKLINNLS